MLYESTRKLHIFQVIPFTIQYIMISVLKLVQYLQAAKWIPETAVSPQLTINEPFTPEEVSSRCWCSTSSIRP